RAKAHEFSVSQQSRGKIVPNGFLEDFEGAWRSRRHPETADPTCPASFVCNAFAGAGSRPAGSANNARTRRYFDDRDIYSRHAGTPEGNLQNLPSPRVTWVIIFPLPAQAGNTQEETGSD